MDSGLVQDTGFIWFQGVVEDRDDPLKLGRCRVRCLGFHTPNKDQLKTEDLPWAHPVQPITSAAMNGLGQTPVGLVTGTWVFGFFRDGINAQHPVIVGTMGGIPQSTADTNFGFSDPSGIYPKEDFVGEPDTNRLARNENIDQTIVQTKTDNLDEMEIATGVGGQDTITEPVTPYAAQYPLNKVNESESGHIIEIDDTEDAERIHVYHKSGTFVEIHPDGSMVRKVANKSHEVFVDDNNIHVKGDHNITVDGNLNIYTKGDVTMKTDGNFKHDVEGAYELNVGGNVHLIANNGMTSISMVGGNIRQIATTAIHLN